MSTTMTITLTIGAALLLLNTWLMMRCGQVRAKESIDIGDDGNDLLIRRMRAHSNFVESTPLVLAMIAVTEYTSGTSTWLWALGIIYVLGRIGHAFGMDGGSLKVGRMIGTLTTMLSQLVLAIMALVTVYSAIL